MDYKWILAVVIFIVAFFVDKNFSLWINSLSQENLTLVISLITKYITSLTIFIIITLIFIKKKKQMLLAWASYFLSGIIALIFKLTIARPRPFQALNFALVKGVNYSLPLWNSSFPSWHVASMFSIMPFLKNKAKLYWLFFAIIIAFSRIYIGMHYLSDVIGGALIGYLAGLLVLKLAKRYK